MAPLMDLRPHEAGSFQNLLVLCAHGLKDFSMTSVLIISPSLLKKVLESEILRWTRVKSAELLTVQMEMEIININYKRLNFFGLFAHVLLFYHVVRIHINGMT